MAQKYDGAGTFGQKLPTLPSPYASGVDSAPKRAASFATPDSTHYRRNKLGRGRRQGSDPLVTAAVVVLSVGAVAVGGTLLYKVYQKYQKDGKTKKSGGSTG